MKFTACFLCFLTVALGAMGAHLFKETLDLPVYREKKQEDPSQLDKITESMDKMLGDIGMSAELFKDRMQSRSRKDYFHLATKYIMFHGLAMLALAGAFAPGKLRGLTWLSFVIGCLLFSGSLYMISFTGNPTWGRVTPIGGMAFLIGWLFAMLACFFSGKPKEASDGSTA